jgi:hypothetical protein
MKVVFLDIDGVLNRDRTPNPRKFPYIADKTLVRRLKKVLAYTHAKVVLSSTWRYDPVGLLAAKHFGIPFVDCIPDLPHRPRRDEIRRWLKKHPRVTRYAVLDDEDDELDDLPLFQPSAHDGLTAELAKALGDYLLIKTDQDRRRNAVVRLAENIMATVTGHQG